MSDGIGGITVGIDGESQRVLLVQQCPDGPVVSTSMLASRARYYATALLLAADEVDGLVSPPKDAP